jgi:hypothetical protein
MLVRGNHAKGENVRNQETSSSSSLRLARGSLQIRLLQGSNDQTEGKCLTAQWRVTRGRQLERLPLTGSLLPWRVLPIRPAASVKAVIP